MTTLNEDHARAVLFDLGRQLLGIEQVDAVLTEDGTTVLLYGHTDDEDVTYVASLPVPELRWRRA